MELRRALRPARPRPAVLGDRRPARQFVDRFGPILEHGRADFYVAGHEHVTWDETFALPSGAPLRQ
ncbi:MAG TPA: hypothetical protein VFT22_43055 [Kofleriaceae bacterium]|nr:hypothetical protein [Kofleriaceae bacterium]